MTLFEIRQVLDYALLDLDNGVGDFRNKMLELKLDLGERNRGLSLNNSKRISLTDRHLAFSMRFHRHWP